MRSKSRQHGTDQVGTVEEPTLDTLTHVTLSGRAVTVAVTVREVRNRLQAVLDGDRVELVANSELAADFFIGKPKILQVEESFGVDSVKELMSELFPCRFVVILGEIKSDDYVIGQRGKQMVTQIARFDFTYGRPSRVPPWSRERTRRGILVQF